MRVVWVVAVALLAVGMSAAASELSEQLEGKSPEERIGYLRNLIDRGGADAEVHFQMGNAFYSTGEMDSCIAHLVRATELDAGYAKAWVNLGIAYDTKGAVGQARYAYESAIEINPQDVLAYCHLGFNYFSRGEKDRAIELYTKALEIDPRSAQGHYNLGLAFAEARIFAEALREWNLVIELEPDGDLGRVARENVGLIEAYLELEQ
jgi:tetratricopeptide (TPR) repeat protein